MEGIKSIRLDITTAVHTLIKVTAAKQGKSMRQFILDALDREIKASENDRGGE